jgi:hypothetical protein
MLGLDKGPGYLTPGELSQILRLFHSRRSCLGSPWKLQFGDLPLAMMLSPVSSMCMHPDEEADDMEPVGPIMAHGLMAGLWYPDRLASRQITCSRCSP